jgi:hypothetical protein
MATSKAFEASKGLLSRGMSQYLLGLNLISAGKSRDIPFGFVGLAYQWFEDMDRGVFPAKVQAEIKSWPARKMLKVLSEMVDAEIPPVDSARYLIAKCI